MNNLVVETGQLPLPKYDAGVWKFSCCGTKIAWNNPYGSPNDYYGKDETKIPCQKCPSVYAYFLKSNRGTHSYDLLKDDDGFPIKTNGHFKKVATLRNFKWISEYPFKFKEETYEYLLSCDWAVKYECTNLIWSLQGKYNSIEKFNDFITGSSNIDGLYDDDINHITEYIESNPAIAIKLFQTLINNQIEIKILLQEISRRILNAGGSLTGMF